MPRRLEKKYVYNMGQILQNRFLLKSIILFLFLKESKQIFKLKKNIYIYNTNNYSKLII